MSRLGYLVVSASLFVLAGCGAGGDSISTAPTAASTAQAPRQTPLKGTNTPAASYTAAVQELYIAYFGRPADTGGLANFTAALAAAGAPTDIQTLNSSYNSNSTVKTLVDAFGTSAESNALYTGTTTDFVNAIYTHVLSRTADTAGRQFWVNAIDQGILTKGNAALSIMAGALANTTTQGLIDAQVVTKKVTIGTNFTAALQSDPTRAAYAYSGDAAAAAARNMLSTVTSNTDTGTFQATVNSTISTLISSGTVATLRGTAAAGPIINGDVKVYDATTYVPGGSNTPIATATTGSDGSYSASLPPNFSNPVYVKVTGKSNGSSSMNDEVFGTTSIDANFSLEAVIPSSMVTASNGTITAHVTPYTQAMATYVTNKLGKSDIDAAITAARSNVKSNLTGGTDPLTTSTTDPKMLALLAAVSNIAKASTATATTDPYNCTGKTSTADKIACAVKTVSGVMEPLASTASASTAATVIFNNVSALKTAASNLDTAALSTKTGVTQSTLDTNKSTVSTSLTTVAAAVPNGDKGGGWISLWPAVTVQVTINGRECILSGPGAGCYTGWSYAAVVCRYSTTNCLQLGPSLAYTPQDLMDDPSIATTYPAMFSRIVSTVNAMLVSAHKARPTSPMPIAEIQSAIAAGVAAGIQAQDAGAGLTTFQNALSQTGFPPASDFDLNATPDASNSSDSTAAAQACANKPYQNPGSNPYDPQIDSHCQVVQFDTCLHNEAHVTTYDSEAISYCQLISDFAKAANSNFSCMYCPFPKP